MSDSGRTRERKTAREDVEEVEAPARDDSAQEALDEVDDLLDEIDEVLEENAEEFIKNYVQKGGE